MAGDPDKASAIIIEVAEQKEPPLHLFPGKDAYQMADAKIKSIQQNMDAVREPATTTDFGQ